MCLSRNSFASHLNYSKALPYCVLAEIQSHLIEIFLRQSRIVSQSKFICISSTILYDDSKICPSHNSIATLWSYSRTIPKCVLVETQLHLIEIILWKCQIVSQPKFNCLSLKLFEEKSILRQGRNSISSHRSCSKTFPNCVLGERQLHLIENNLRQFHNVYEPKLNCISSKLF